MRRLLAAAAALLVSGCATQVGPVLQQGKPIAMFTLDCQGYVVQSGLPLPLGQRMEELDELCPGSMTPPDRRVPASPARR